MTACESAVSEQRPSAARGEEGSEVRDKPGLGRRQGSPARQAIGAARTLVVKVGSSSLTTSTGGLDPARLDELVDGIAGRVAAGCHVVLVSSGAIAAGLAPLRLRRRPRDLATQQAAASVGQQLLAQRYAGSFARHGLTVGQVLLTSDDVVRRAHYRNAQRTFAKLLGFGVVPVVNENDTVATEEIRFGDNDRLAALVAHLVGADGLVLLSDVDALYTAPPQNPGATRIAHVPYGDELAGVEIGATQSGWGTGGAATKVQAARLAAEAGTAVLLTETRLLAALLDGEDHGTVFDAGPRRAK